MTSLIYPTYHLYESAAIGNVEGMRIAVENGADIDSGAGEALGLACKFSNFEAVKYLVDSGCEYLNYGLSKAFEDKIKNKDIIDYILNERSRRE